jgi:hypothetical protein
MTTAPAKDREKQKEDRDNIFVAILYNIVVQLPVMAIAWVISQFSDD